MAMSARACKKSALRRAVRFAWAVAVIVFFLVPFIDIVLVVAGGAGYLATVDVNWSGARNVALYWLSVSTAAGLAAGIIYWAVVTAWRLLGRHDCERVRCQWFYGPGPDSPPVDIPPGKPDWA